MHFYRAAGIDFEESRANLNLTTKPWTLVVINSWKLTFCLLTKFTELLMTTAQYARQGLYNGRASVCLSRRSTAATAAGQFASALRRGHKISTNRCEGAEGGGAQQLIGNESVPIQLAQCWFRGLAISNAKI